MRLLRPHHAAQPHHQVVVGKSVALAQLALVLRRPAILKALEIDTVVDHHVPPSVQAMHMPVVGLSLADEDQQVGAAHHVVVQRHVPGVLA